MHRIINLLNILIHLLISIQHLQEKLIVNIVLLLIIECNILQYNHRHLTLPLQLLQILHYSEKIKSRHFRHRSFFGNDRQTILRTNKLNLSAAYHKGMG
jgi:hypothetical protein